jgi:hypothetical protein
MFILTSWNKDKRMDFYQTLIATDSDGVMISGDIAEATSHILNPNFGVIIFGRQAIVLYRLVEQV